QQPSYAPELAGLIVGAAAGGTVPNITTVIAKVNGSPFAGLIPAGVLGLAFQFPALKPLIDAHILPQHRDDFYKARDTCLFGDTLLFGGRDVLAMFDDRAFINTSPLARQTLADNSLGHRVPRVPLYIYKGTSDEISPIEDTDQLVETYCADGKGGGATVQYDRLPRVGHAMVLLLGSQKALSWLDAVMSGQSTEQFGPYKCRGT
ncbi:hypothetical protein E4U21_004946, partial [Claviceps maximensis]